MKPEESDHARIARMFAEGKPIDDAIKAGARQALLRHKREGQPAVGWENGQLIVVPPEQIDEYMARKGGTE